MFKKTNDKVPLQTSSCFITHSCKASISLFTISDRAAGTSKTVVSTTVSGNRKLNCCKYFKLLQSLTGKQWAKGIGTKVLEVLG